MSLFLEVYCTMEITNFFFKPIFLDFLTLTNDQMNEVFLYNSYYFVILIIKFLIFIQDFDQYLIQVKDRSMALTPLLTILQSFTINVWIWF